MQTVKLTCLLLFLWTSNVCLAAVWSDLSERHTPIKQEFASPLSFPDSAEIFIRGLNRHQSNSTLIVRLDDVASKSYRTRANVERVIPNGEFTIRLPLNGLRTSGGRLLNHEKIKRIYIFVGDKQPELRLYDVKIVTGVSLPAPIVAWDFGSPQSPVFPGFAKVTPSNSHAIAGKNLQHSWRKGGDALISDGIRGLDHIHLDLAPGSWSVALWTEDIGDWEYLPHPLQQKITANGHVIHRYEYSPEQWISKRYLVGQAREYQPEMTPWELFGERRGGLIVFEVDVEPSKGISIQLESSSREGLYLSALLA